MLHNLCWSFEKSKFIYLSKNPTSWMNTTCGVMLVRAPISSKFISSSFLVIAAFIETSESSSSSENYGSSIP